MRSRLLNLFLIAAVAVTVATISTGCSKMLGNLRRDLDDSEPYSEPVVGGRWTERGFLADYDSVGHTERSPASAMNGGSLSQNSWVTPERAEANQRDFYRDMDGEQSEVQSTSNTANMEPPVKRRYKNGSRATRADFIDESQNEGSLWASDGQTNYYFTKNKIRGVGDIVTLTLDEGFIKDVGQEFKRTLTPREKTAELGLAQERIRARVLGLEDPDKKGKDSVTASAAAPAREPASTDAKSKAPAQPAEEPTIPNAIASDIDVLKSVEIKANDTMMAEIIERYPNGNYKIRGTKKVLYRNGSPRFLSIVAVVKGTDIAEDDTVNSGKLYEYRLEAVR